MGKFPFSKPNPKVGNKNKSRPFIGEVNGFRGDELPVVTQSAASDDAASSVNRKPVSNFSQSQYMSFDLASYSKTELCELKDRLVSDLEQIRQLKNRIESGDFRTRSTHNAAQKKVMSKKVSGNKRPLPLNVSRESKKPQLQSQTQSRISGTRNTDLMKSCSQLLTKLMKHKNGWVFNVPVDAVALGLHDYYNVIKQPMDLGTVKSKLRNNLYASPFDFADDVRLTFNNAILYNPKGHDVYTMAEQLLMRFEELFRPMTEKLEAGQQQEQVYEDELQASSWNQFASEREKKESPMATVKTPLQTRVPAPKVLQSPERTPEQMPAHPVQSVKQVKQPKPRAKDPNKRDMTMEEKHKLGLGLQNLPQEKIEQVVQIIRKRNGHLPQDGDEIELDIETVDNETLWELDRFVTNWKKLVSKIKRQALMNTNTTSSSAWGNEELPASEGIDVVKEEGEGDVVEDVNLNLPAATSNDQAMGMEKEVGKASSSSSDSSSSGGSSSSSDSESGSSSGSDSDADKS